MTETGAEDISREAISRIQRFIDHKPRTAFEVRSKLRSIGYTENVNNEVVEYLADKGVLDDERYMIVFTEELLRKKYGYKRILAELSKKGIEKDKIERFKEDYPHETEIERAREACRFRLNKNSIDENPKNKAKIVGYLMRRGFAKNIAEEAVNSLTEQV